MKTKILLFVTILSIIVKSNAFSNTIAVTTGKDSITGSLRDAISKAQKGDVIIFDKSLTQIQLGEQISFDKSITISGNPKLYICDNRWDSSGGSIVHRFFEIFGSDSIIVNINNLEFRKDRDFVNDTVSLDLNGKIILAHNTKQIVNIDFCYFTVGNTSVEGWINNLGNYNNQNGGGIAQEYGGTINISNCTFSNLEAGGQVYNGAGGAICQFSGVLNLINCTFYQNSIADNPSSSEPFIGAGSAIYSQNSTMSITNCTFCEHKNNYYWGFYPNNTSKSTSTIYLNKTNLKIENSIFYDNGGNDFNGNITSGGYNIFDQSSITGSVSSDMNNCNPGFTLKNSTVVLSDSTFWIPVCVLNYAGCAVNALPSDGNGAPKYDERGFTRIGNSDIGAYEYKGSLPTTLNVSTNNLSISASANNTKTFDIISNISWTATSDQPWLKISSASGSGNATLTISSQSNQTNSTRTATVTISGTGVSEPNYYSYTIQSSTSFKWFSCILPFQWQCQ